MFDRVRPLHADSGKTVVAPTPHSPRRARTLAGADPAAAPAAASGPALGPGTATGVHRLAAAPACGHCGARVQELRRGRCWGCYQAWARLRPVGQGARCVICPERRRDSLRLAEIRGRWLPMCHTCATRAQQLPVLPHTVDALRRALSRDRRQADRRIGALDVRSDPQERRRADRRAPTAESTAPTPGTPTPAAAPATDASGATAAPASEAPTGAPPTGAASAEQPSLTAQAQQARTRTVARVRRAPGPNELGDVDYDLDLNDQDVMEVTGVVDDLTNENQTARREATAPTHVAAL